MSSSSIFDRLPDHLLWEIFLLLRVKHLARLRSVSRYWNTLISNPEFINFHVRAIHQDFPKNTQRLITYQPLPFQQCMRSTLPCSINTLLRNPTYTIYSPNRLIHRLTVLGVCNGLVCLVRSRFYRPYRKHYFCLWNPVTKITSNNSPQIYTTHDMYRCSCRFAFGYDNSSDRYQVVVMDNKPTGMYLKVQTFGDPGWRWVFSCPTLPILSLHGVFLSGTVNWLVLLNSTPNNNDQKLSIKDMAIFSYDLKEKTCSYLSMCDDLLEDLLELSRRPPQIQVLRGRMCLSFEGKTGFDVWLMMKFGVKESWTRLMNVSYNHLYDRGPDETRPVPEILCSSENDDAILLANYDKLQFVLCNRINNRIYNLGPFNKGLIFHPPFDFDESLVSPNRN